MVCIAEHLVVRRLERKGISTRRWRVAVSLANPGRRSLLQQRLKRPGPTRRLTGLGCIKANQSR